MKTPPLKVNSIEHRLLLAASMLEPDPTQIVLMQELLPRLEDQDAFVSIAIHEGLGGLLYKNLKKANLLETLKDSCRQDLFDFYHQTAFLNMARIREIKEVLQELAPTFIRVVFLKGFALIHTLYADVGLRPMTDIDIWVQAEDLQEFITLLLHLGYEQDPFYPATLRKGLTVLDIKTHLLGADRIKSRTLLLKGGQEPVFRRVRPLSIEGQRAFMLDPYDQILYLTLHAFKHNAEKMNWLVEIRELTRHWKPSEWQMLFTRAAEMGLERTLLHLLFLLRKFLDYPAEEIITTGDQRLTLLETILLKRRIKNGALPEWAPLIFYSRKTDLKGQLHYILETLFPRPDILRQSIKNSADLKVWQLYGLRFFDLGRRALTSLFK